MDAERHLGCVWMGHEVFGVRVTIFLSSPPPLWPRLSHTLPWLDCFLRSALREGVSAVDGMKIIQPSMKVTGFSGASSGGGGGDQIGRCWQMTAVQCMHRHKSATHAFPGFWAEGPPLPPIAAVALARSPRDLAPGESEAFTYDFDDVAGSIRFSLLIFFFFFDLFLLLRTTGFVGAARYR